MIAIGLVAVTLAVWAAEVDTTKLPPPSTQKGVTFAKDIQPIFEKSCVPCHGGERPKAKLNLAALESALKGGADGKVIEPGNSANSKLVHGIAHITADEDYYMPPPGNKKNIEKLTNDQIALIRAWIDQGAK